MVTKIVSKEALNRWNSSFIFILTLRNGRIPDSDREFEVECLFICSVFNLINMSVNELSITKVSQQHTTVLKLELQTAFPYIL